VSTWAGHAHGSPGYRRLVGALFVSGFATFAQVFDVQAVLPLLSRELDISPATAALTISVTTMGIAASVLPWASLADRIGRSAVLRLSLGLTAIISLLTPFMPTVELLIANRALTGVLLGGVPAIAMTYLNEEIAPRFVTVAAGTYVAGNTVGGVFGRLVAGPLGEATSWRWGLLTVAMVGALGAALFYLLLPPAHGFQRQEKRSARDILTLVAGHLRDPALARVYVMGFLGMGMFAAVYNYLAFHVAEPPFDLPPGVSSLLFLAYFIGAGSAQVSTRLSMRWGPHRVMTTGALLMLVGLGLMALPYLVAVVAGLVVFTVGAFCVHPVASSQSGQLPTHARSQSTALYQLSWLGGTALIGWVFGLVYDGIGWTALIGFAGVLALVSAFVARGTARPPGASPTVTT